MDEDPDPKLPRPSNDTYGSDEEIDENGEKKPRELPDDLPTSLDDRRSVPTFSSETEMYDAWQGPHFYDYEYIYFEKKQLFVVFFFTLLSGNGRLICTGVCLFFEEI